MRVPPNRFRRSQRSGSVLAMAVMVMIVVAGMTLAFLQIGVRFSSEQSNRIDDERALMLAEVGLEESITAMRLGLSGNMGNAAAPALQGDGVVWATATPVGQSLNLVLASGMCGSGRAAVQSLVFKYPPDYLESFAIFANTDLTINSNVLVDSFDISNGVYADQLAATGTGHVDERGVSGSNGNITVDSAVEFWGDLHPGVNKSISVASSASVSGSLQPLPELVVLPPVTTPVLPVSPDVVISGVGVPIPSGDYQYGSFETMSNSSVTIVGPTRIVTDDLFLRSNSILTLDTTAGPIEIYIRGDSDLASNAQIITSKQSATDCSIYMVGGPAQTISFNSNSEFYGRIYSQEGEIVIGANFGVYGSVVADRLVLDANSQVHYDEGLSGGINNEDYRYIAYSWSTAPFPIPNFLSDRRDPFALLGVARAALSSPADAHAP